MPYASPAAPDLSGWPPAAALAGALRRAGLRPGDAILVEASDAALGGLACHPAGLAPAGVLASLLREAVGPGGLLFVPAFTGSFFRQEVFDPAQGPAPGSPSRLLGEALVGQSGWSRSADPNASILGSGPGAAEMLAALAPTTYGAGCFFERLLERGGRLCLLGTPGETPVHLDFIHYAEERLGVPFRYRRLWTGRVREDSRLLRRGWVTSTALEAPEAQPDCARVAGLLARAGSRAAEGGHAVLLVDCVPLWEELRRCLGADPWFTAAGPPGDPATLEPRGRLGLPEVALPPDASMEQIIAALWRLPRHIVSEGYDVALRALATQAPMEIHEYASGSECWSWIVPEQWTCHQARLETMDGRTLVSAAENPLHVVAYSLGCDRVVPREELLPHLHTHPTLPDAIPFVFKYYERDWGLCLSQRQKAALTDSHYRVVLDTAFTRGALKVGEIVARGRSPRSFVLCAHLCHPAMVNDDLSGVVVGLKVMQALAARRDLHYTYRLLVLPETIGSVAYLGGSPQRAAGIEGGLFLEMLGLDQPHALQLSFAGDTELDRCLSGVLAARDAGAWTGAFRTVVGNDERQFNAPGVRIPMLSLSRVERAAPGRHPYYPQYHSSLDTPELAPEQRLADSRDLVLAMVDALERRVIPVNRFAGEICCSRYGLHVDAYEDPEGNRALFDVLFLIDGTRSVEEIARRSGASPQTVARLVLRLERLGLVDLLGPRQELAAGPATEVWR